MAAAKTINVRGTAAANPDGSYPVALWEKDPAHPTGEVYIAGPAPVAAAETPGVNGALRDGLIEKCDAAPAPAPPPAAPKAP